MPPPALRWQVKRKIAQRALHRLLFGTPLAVAARCQCSTSQFPFVQQ